MIHVIETGRKENVSAKKRMGILAKAGTFTRQILHGPNRYYGHEYILKRYCSVRHPSVIVGDVQHGWRRDNGFYEMPGIPEQRRLEKTTYFVWNRHNRREALNMGAGSVFAIGAPFIYLNQKRSGTAEKGSLILFPFHTWEKEPYVDELESFRSYLHDIGHIRDSFTSITMCLYWLQYRNADLRELISAMGIRLLCLGNRDGNPQFLVNFMNHVSRFEYVSSNVYSSALFYALFMKRKAFIYGECRPKEIRWMNTPNGLQDVMKREYPELLWENFADISHDEIGRRELGWEFRRSPGELRSLLGLTPRRQWEFFTDKMSRALSRMS